MGDVWLVLVAWAVAVLLMLLGWQGARLEWDESIEFLDDRE